MDAFRLVATVVVMVGVVVAILSVTMVLSVRTAPRIPAPRETRGGAAE